MHVAAVTGRPGESGVAEVLSLPPPPCCSQELAVEQVDEQKSVPHTCLDSLQAHLSGVLVLMRGRDSLPLDPKPSNLLPTSTSPICRKPPAPSAPPAPPAPRQLGLGGGGRRGEYFPSQRAISKSMHHGPNSKPTAGLRKSVECMQLIKG